MSQIVQANHADSIRVTRPDGTTMQIPAACVLAVDAVMRRILDTHEQFRVNRLEIFEGGWLASLWVEGTEGGIFGGGETPWRAVMSLLGKLMESNP